MSTMVMRNTVTVTVPSSSSSLQSIPKQSQLKASLSLKNSTKVPMPNEKMLRKGGRSLFSLMFGRKKLKDPSMKAHQHSASVLHALVVIFLEYFAWGLLTVPVINVLAETFPTNKFLMNGLVLGIKGILSFLSAPLVGALSDIWGRKFFLVLTVFCTCMPIPCLKISPWWYFSLFSISGLFSVTFSVVLAYVADITEKQDRSAAYGLVSATFAASLVTSPALGAWMSERYGDGIVVFVATLVALLDVLFIVVMVPESLSNRKNAADALSWQSADPFATLRIVWDDKLVLQLATIVFLSYLPEAGQFSCFFVYLKLVVGFSPEAVAAFIGLVGILSVVAQTGVLLLLTDYFGTKHTITLGLTFQLAQLMWYGLGTQYWMMWAAGVLAAMSSIILYWMMWAAGVLAAMSSITYPSISAFVSILSDKDKQGTVQGVITGIRGLCQGFGPALFGFVFYLFDVDLNVDGDSAGHMGLGPQFPVPNIRRVPLTSGEKILTPRRNETAGVREHAFDWQLIPGPPFVAGALLVLFALLINSTLPMLPSGSKYLRRTTSHTRQGSDTDRLICDEPNPHL